MKKEKIKILNKFKSKKFVFIFYIAFLALFSILIFSVYAVNIDTDRYCPECGVLMTYNSRVRESDGSLIETWTCPNGHNDLGGSTNQREITDGITGETTASDQIMGDEKLLKEYAQIRKMIKDMCSTNEGLSDDDIFNSDAMINKMYTGMIEAINEFQSSPVYSCLVGVGIFILLINFSFSFYQNMPNIERKTHEQIMKMLFQFILALFIILNIGAFLNLAIVLSQWLLNNAIILKNGQGGFGTDGQSIADTLTIKILKEAGLDNESVLDKFLGFFKGMVITITLFLPWIVCLCAKLGILFSIAKNSIETIVYAMFYPIAAGDCYENIKHSNFMKYTKHIFGCLMQLAIIVLIMYASNILLKNIIDEIVNNLSTASTFNKIFEILVLLTIIQLSKTVVVMSSTSVIAHKAFGE